MADKTMFDELIFLCALLSPYSSEAEINQLTMLAAGGRVDWKALARTVNRSELAPALYLSLGRTGISTGVPEMFREYLEEVHRLNLLRNEALLGQLRHVVRLLNDIGVTPLLLKGGAALATDLFPEPGMRFMWDLDLLVPEERLEQSVAALLAGGYETAEEDASGALTRKAISTSHHHDALICPGAPASVELHYRVLGKNIDLLQPDEVWGDCRPYVGTRLPGASALVMSPNDELLYCFAHSELAHGHHRYARVDARQLHHFTYLCYRYNEQIDWKRMSLFRQHPLYGHIFNAYLCLAERLFQLDISLKSDPDAYAEQHWHTVTSVRHGWKLQLHKLRLLYRELVWAFSGERLRDVYQEKDEPLIGLRLRHLRFLLGRYTRLEPWRRRLRGMAPF